jgi:hypothetical protein
MRTSQDADNGYTSDFYRHANIGYTAALVVDALTFKTALNVVTRAE